MKHYCRSCINYNIKFKIRVTKNRFHVCRANNVVSKKRGDKNICKEICAIYTIIHEARNAGEMVVTVSEYVSLVV